MPELTGRAKVYATILKDLSGAEGLTGRGASVERGARFLSFGVRLSDPRQIDKALRLSEALALATRTPVVIARREGGLILYQFQLASGYWESYTRADLHTDREHVGVGLAEGRRQVDLSFDMPHWGVFGITGSGKTKTVQSMLAGLFTAYSPDELQAVIVDMKAEKYADFTNVAHLRGIPIAHTDQEIDGVLSFVNGEIAQRESNAIFDARRLVVVIDEAEAIFSNNARLQIGAALVKRGREVRIHGLFATQEPHKKPFKYLLHQIEGRWVGLVDDAHTSRFITGRAGLECHKLTGRGDFVSLRRGGLFDRLQVALPTRDDFDRLPRAEIAPPELPVTEPLDPDRLPEDPQGPGRRREEVDPTKLAHYLFFREGVTQRYAHDVLGLGKDLHYRHRAFARQTIEEIKRLMRGQANGR